MLYCIEVDRSGLPEEDMVLHYNFDYEPTREEIVKKIIDEEDCGYNDDYCDVEFYRID